MSTALELVNNPVFGRSEAMRRVLVRTPARARSVPAHKVVFVQGEHLRQLTIIVEGRLTATIESPGGQTLLVETLSPFDIIAPAMLFGSRPVLPVTLTAATDTRLVSIETEAFRSIAERFPAVYERFLAVVSEKFEFLTTKMRLLHFATLREKIAGYVLERMRDQNAVTSRTVASARTVELPYGRDRLAELFGVARPSLSRALGGMVNDGLLVVSGKKIEVLRPDRLKSIASSSYRSEEAAD